MSDPVLPASAEIGRVALHVADAESVAAFYETVVGLERLPNAPGESESVPEQSDLGPESERSDGTAVADRVVLGADETPLLLLLEDPDAPPREERAAGLYHTAVRVPDRAALGSAIERIRDAGALDGAADHLVSEAVYLTDPEGNGVEVYADRPREEWTFLEDRVRIDTLPLDLDSIVAESDGSDRVPPGTDVGHVHLEVTDLAAAREFYVDALGTNLRDTFGDDALFVAAGDYHHHVGLNTWQDRDRPAGGSTDETNGATRGLAWFEFALPDRDALDAATERLRDAGYEVATPTDATPADAPPADAAPADTAADAVVRDPDGIELRLTVVGE